MPGKARRLLAAIGAGCSLTLGLAALRANGLEINDADPKAPTAAPVNVTKKVANTNKLDQSVIIVQARGLNGEELDDEPIHINNRRFRIPFNMNIKASSLLRELKLCYSTDSGQTWEPSEVAPPEKGFFSFKGNRDGLHWFSMQTVHTNGKISPQNTDVIQPKLKVVIDTAKPSLILEPQNRRDSTASVYWEAHDEHLDLRSFYLEFLAPGPNGVWTKVPISDSKASGTQVWDTGTTEAIKVAMKVADFAGNIRRVEIDIPAGPNSKPTSLANTNPPAPEASEPDPAPTTKAVSSRTETSNPAVVEPTPTPTPAATASKESGISGLMGATKDPFSPPVLADFNNPFRSEPTPAAPPGKPTTSGVSSEGSMSMKSPGGRASIPTLVVGNPRFPLRYNVDDAGPEGPAIVELWVTRDGGRTWSRMPEDPDRVSPYLVDLGGEGIFGLCLVARSVTGQGDLPPAPGQAPELWVEVDSTPPQIQLDPPVVGTGENAGKISVTWRANDAHLESPCVLLQYRADEPNSPWIRITDPMANTGQYVWNVPSSVSPRIHIRIDVIDKLKNRSFADTVSQGPLILDRSRPKGRILGLDPSFRTGSAVR